MAKTWRVSVQGSLLGVWNLHSLSLYLLVTFLQNMPFFPKSTKSLAKVHRYYKKGTQTYHWLMNTKVVIFSQKSCETLRNCSSCNRVSIRDRGSQTWKIMLQPPGWRRRYSNHRKIVQHSLPAPVQPKQSNFTVLSFLNVKNTYFKYFQLLR